MSTEASWQTKAAAHAVELVRPSHRLVSLFHLYVFWYLRRHFHALRLANADRFPATRRPLIVYLNHASWWDPLVSMLLSHRFLMDADHYAPMDAEALKRYGVFRRLGLFPVEMGTPRGAAQFMRAANHILSQPDSLLWITPEGHFKDVRARPVVFKPGLSALLSRLDRVTVVPIAIEYTFWDERLPEILVNCGEPLHIGDGRAEDAVTWNNLLAHAMTTTLDELASLAAKREAANFETLIAGGSGIGGIYELWQRACATLRGENYKSEHGSIHRA
jgi:1-acyl-sn-glycerol-3-phosphate acyltransferase